MISNTFSTLMLEETINLTNFNYGSSIMDTNLKLILCSLTVHLITVGEGLP
jgi:fluoride ion exporter CrcB/FEX